MQPSKIKLAEIHEEIDLALESRDLLFAAMELLVPANYISVLVQQLSSKEESITLDDRNETSGHCIDNTVIIVGEQIKHLLNYFYVLGCS